MVSLAGPTAMNRNHGMKTQTHQIKILLSPKDHDQFRIAAALRRATMAGFCRSVVMTETTRVLKGMGGDVGEGRFQNYIQKPDFRKCSTRP